MTLPPGRARLATNPKPTGSPDTAKTIGICGATRFITMESLVDDVTIRSTLSRTNSAAISSSRSGRPAAQRDSIVIVWPSIQPSSRSRCKSAPVVDVARTFAVDPTTIGRLGGAERPLGGVAG